MSKENDIRYMKQYLHSALELETCKYSVTTAMQYTTREQRKAKQQADALEQTYLNAGIELAGYDKSSYIEQQRNSIGSVGKARFWSVFFAIGFIILCICTLLLHPNDSIASVLGIIWGFGFWLILLSILFHFAARRRKKARSDEVLSEKYNEMYKKATADWEETGSNQVKMEQRASEMSVRLNELKQEADKIQSSLNALYAENVLHESYRHLAYVGTLYGYIERGRCTTVMGHGGIYDTLETELKQNAIIVRLDRISNQLDAIRANQRYLYDAIQEGNQIANNICREIEAGNRANQMLFGSMAMEQKRHNAMQEWQNTRAYYGY